MKPSLTFLRPRRTIAASLLLLAFALALAWIGWLRRGPRPHPLPLIAVLRLPASEVGAPNEFSFDGSSLVTFLGGPVPGGPGFLRVWDVPSGRLRFTAASRIPPPDVDFSPDHQRIAFLDSDGRYQDVVRILRASDGALLYSFPTPNAIAIHFSTDSSTIQVLQLVDDLVNPPDSEAGVSRRIAGWVLRAFDLADGRERPSREISRGWSAPFSSLGFEHAISTDLTRLAHLNSDELGVTILDVENLLAPVVLANPDSHSKIVSVAFAREGPRIALGRENGHIEVWDAAARRLVANPRHHPDFIPGQVHLSGRGSSLSSLGGSSANAPTVLDRYIDALESWFPKLVIRSPQTENLVWDLASSPPTLKCYTNQQVFQVVSPDGRFAAGASDFYLTIPILDLRNHVP